VGIGAPRIGMPLTAGVSAAAKRPWPLLGDGRRSRLGQWTCPGNVGCGAGSAVVKGVGGGGVAGVGWVSALGASLMGVCRVRFRDDVWIGRVYWWDVEVSSMTLCQYALEYDMRSSSCASMFRRGFRRSAVSSWVKISSQLGFWWDP